MINMKDKPEMYWNISLNSQYYLINIIITLNIVYKTNEFIIKLKNNVIENEV